MMRFKRYILAISLAMGTCLQALACACDDHEASRYNLFRCVEKLPDAKQIRRDETLKFWSSYTGLPVDELDWCIAYMDPSDFSKPYSNKLLQALDQKGDSSAIGYLGLNTALDKLSHVEDDWDYEKVDREDYERLLFLIRELDVPRKLERRKTFLEFRCLYRLGRTQECEEMWQKISTQWEDCVLRRRVEGYLGGIYYNRGEFDRAIDHFFRLGDDESIKICITKMLNRSSIEAEYRKNPNSKLLGYILEDYANYYYHALANGIAETREDYYPIWHAVYRESGKMEQLAEEVVKEGKAQDLKMWKTFEGFIQLGKKESRKAYETFCQAEKLPGNEVTHSLLRHYKLAAQLESQEEVSAEFDRYLAGEMGYYLDGKFSNDTEKEILEMLYDEELRGRIRRYLERKSNPMMAKFFASVTDRWGQWDHLDLDREMSDKEIEELRFVLAVRRSDDPFIQAMMSYNRMSMDCITELLATRCLREGKFVSAACYYDMVSLDYFNKLRTAPYLACRKLSDLPFRRKDFKNLDEKRAHLSTNVKRDYCMTVVRLQRQIDRSEGEERNDLLLKLADLLFQASPTGDLWAISEYGDGNHYNGHYNHLNTQVDQLLREVIGNTKDEDLKIAAYYGLAANPENGCVPHFDWNNKIVAQKSQVEAYKWLKNHKKPNHPVFRNCDWLKFYVSEGR